jgi:hypothetical protein
MTKKERLMNRGPQAIIDIYADLGKSLVDDINDQFGEEFYIDGNATGNTKRIHGSSRSSGPGRCPRTGTSA